jgi:fumarate reductase flavoprotein subunit
MVELRTGRLIRADSLEALAGALGIDAAGLRETLDRYHDGDKDFGRTSLSSGWGKPERIERPPFYGYPSRSAVVGTYCGLAVDETLRVRDVFGDPVPGLFAAGHVMGGFHGAGYMTGTALSKAAVFGRQAARAAV